MPQLRGARERHHAGRRPPEPQPGRVATPLRLAVYTDYAYRRQGHEVYAERAFALFLAHLDGAVERLTILGRVAPEPGVSHYRIPQSVAFVGLPYYAAATRPLSALSAMVRSLRRCWRALDDVDCVWLFGPHLLGLGIAALARLRGRGVVLGVRQDLPRYVRSRHPERRWIHAAGDLLEAAWRALARRYAVVVVGRDLARRYQRAPRLLTLSVSMITESDIVPPGVARGRSYDGDLRVLSVGRLEEEKNPLLLADVLAELLEGDARWRLVACGEGPKREALRLRLEELDVAHSAELAGYVPIDGGLLEIYRSSHVLLHVSWTEGLPQVLFEAFAAGLPVVATDVGGVREAAGDAAVLIPPGDSGAAVRAVRRIAEEPGLREELLRAGNERARAHTLEAESARVLHFLAAAAHRP